MRCKDCRIGLQELVDGLLFSLQAEGKTPRTIDYYRDLLCPLLDYTRDKGWADGVSLLDAQKIFQDSTHHYLVDNPNTLSKLKC